MSMECIWAFESAFYVSGEFLHGFTQWEKEIANTIELKQKTLQTLQSLQK